ncbi:MAG: SRPBCC family protein [Alistipes sp.]|nr:SRPBCC family protein [Alistipes sp.]
MEKYETKQQQIRKPAEMVWGVMSDFNNFTSLVVNKVEGWHVDGDECSFRVKGMTVGLRMVEKIPGRLIKIEAADASPVGFTLWMQFKEVLADGEGPDSEGFGGEPDTRMRLVLHAEMNMMLKMMIGGKLQNGLDQIAAQIAQTFNSI